MALLTASWQMREVVPDIAGQRVSPRPLLVNCTSTLRGVMCWDSVRRFPQAGHADIPLTAPRPDRELLRRVRRLAPPPEDLRGWRPAGSVRRRRLHSIPMAANPAGGAVDFWLTSARSKNQGIPLAHADPATRPGDQPAIVSAERRNQRENRTAARPRTRDGSVQIAVGGADPALLT